ncbi:uncharacterized protein LOC123307977 [Coccinella septempunctata]|uniref:uncharacterized protein LOC123307977 n=1 Tax=Coccinella septempunctata TaxID=41139 RepID=UPI001D08563E|nr:uncharacterized protein LOC123307977 [Coccinella septempunctata]
MHAFKKLSCMDLLDCVDTFNCAADVDKLLMATVDLPSILEPNIRQPERTPFKITNADFRRNDLPTKNVEQYISGYLLRKCLKKHRCTECQNYATQMEDIKLDNIFCHFKASASKYGETTGNFGKLLAPAESFVQFVSSMEEILMANVKLVATRTPRQLLFEKLRAIPFHHPCSQFPYEYLIHLYIRMRIFYIVKYANQNFKPDECFKRKTNKMRKLLILQHQ